MKQLKAHIQRDSEAFFPNPLNTTESKSNVNTTSTAASSSTSNLNDFVQPQKPNSAETEDENWWTRDKQQRWACCPWGGCLLSKNQWRLLLCSVSCVVGWLIFVLILYTAGPAIVKAIMNQATLDFQSITITNPNSTLQTMQLNAIGSIGNTGSVAADVGPMTMTVSQVIDNEVFVLGSIDMSTLSINGATTINIQTVFKVSNLTSFNRFVHSMIFANTITWFVSATASVTPKLGSISGPTFTDIPFQKTLNIAACGGLLGVTLKVFDLTGSNLTAVKAALSVDIVNPSIFSIQPMGDLSFDMYYLGDYVGTALAPNAFLSGPRASSTVNMSSVITPANLTSLNMMINSFLQGNPSNVTARASNLASTIPLYNTGMQGLALNTVVMGNTNNLVKSMTMSSMSLIPNVQNQTVLFGANVSLTLDSPLGTHSPLNIHTLTMSANMVYNNLTIAALIVPNPVPASGIYTNGSLITLNFAVALSANMMLFGDGTNYKYFVQQFLAADSITVDIVGFSTASITYALGNMVASDFPLTATSLIPGMKGLSQNTVTQTVITGDRSSGSTVATASIMHEFASNNELHPLRRRLLASSTTCTSLCGLNLQIAASIYNPSPASVVLTGGALVMYYNNVPLGQITASLSMQPGMNNVTLSGFLSPASSALDTVSTFMTNFLTGVASTVQLRGASASGSAASASALTVAAMSMTSVVQQAYVPLLTSFTMNQFGIIFAADQSITFNAVSQVIFKLPSNIHMTVNVLRTALSFSISIFVAGSGWISMGTVSSTGLLNVSTTSGSTSQQFNLAVNMTGVPINISPTQLTGFTAFSSKLLSTTAATFLLDGLATTTTASTNLGQVSLSGIPAQNNITLVGYNGFHDTAGLTLMSITNLNMLSATPSTITISTALSISNPSQVYIKGAGALTMDLYFENTKMGTVIVNQFDLGLGMSYFTTSGIVTVSPTNAMGILFLSNYVNMATSNIVLTGGLNGGTSSGTNIAVLQPAIQTFNTTTQVPGLTSPLVTEFLLNVGAAITSFATSCPTKVVIYNPFSVDLILNGGSLSVNIPYNNAQLQIGTWSASNLNILIAPNASTTTTPLNVALTTFSGGIVAFIGVLTTALSALGSGARISSAGQMNVTIGGVGGYTVVLDVSFSNVLSKSY